MLVIAWQMIIYNVFQIMEHYAITQIKLVGALLMNLQTIVRHKTSKNVIIS